jgi:hypothetical protein
MCDGERAIAVVRGTVNKRLTYKPVDGYKKWLVDVCTSANP